MAQIIIGALAGLVLGFVWGLIVVGTVIRRREAKRQSSATAQFLRILRH